MTIKNKFYVAADRIMDGMHGSTWRKGSLDAAIEHAKQLMKTENSRKKYIVKIVAIVEKEEPPVQVTKVS